MNMNWDFTLIYKTQEDYQNDVNRVKELTQLYKDYEGNIKDEKSLLAILKIEDETELRLYKLFTYAHMKYDQNQKNTDSLNEYQKIHMLANELFQAASYVESELISIGKDKLNEYIEKEPSLAIYQFNLNKIFDGEKHILTSDKELLLSYSSIPLRDINSLYDQLAVGDNSDVEVTLTDGSKLTINGSNFRGYLATLKNQEDRRIVFEGIYKFYELHKNTFAGIYKGVIDSDVANMKARNYDSILSSFLENNNIPNEIFLNLINTCKESSEPLKKYYKIRQKAFGLETLHTFDRFLELADFNETYTYDQARELFFEAVKKIGGDFEQKAHFVSEPGRVDVEIKEGKRTGAYSTGTYEEGPFILLNFNKTLDDVFTLAHESGHSIHTMYSNETQPICTAQYTIFVAEVASTFNEQLLLDYLLEKSDNKELKKAILQKAIDSIVGTFYRQALFAAFEYEAHNLAINGMPITHESLSQIMTDLYKDYYDIDLNTEPLKKYVWCYIPHLYHTPFYVYQYSTSFATSLILYEKVKNQEPGAFEKYIDLLKSGGSDYPVNELKAAGVDLTKKETFEGVIQRMSFLVNELEKIMGE